MKFKEKLLCIYIMSVPVIYIIRCFFMHYVVTLEEAILIDDFFTIYTFVEGIILYGWYELCKVLRKRYYRKHERV